MTPKYLEKEKDYEKPERGVVTKLRPQAGLPVTKINTIELCASPAGFGDEALCMGDLPNVFFVCNDCQCTEDSLNPQHKSIMENWKVTWPVLKGRTFSTIPAHCWCGQVRAAD